MGDSGGREGYNPAMLRRHHAPTLFLLLLCLGPATADLRHDLDAIFAHKSLVQVGALVQTLEGETLYERTPDLPLMPASNMKLVTAALALRTWGDHYRFHTRVYGDGPIGADGTLTGNLYLVGAGHPLLDDDFLARLAQALTRDKLQRVAGTVVGVRRLTNGLSDDRELQEAQLLATALRAQGVTLGEAPRTGELPEGACVVREWESDTLETLALHMNKPSNNHIADGLMRSLMIAHQANGAGYDALMKQAWRHLGLDLDGCVFVDGSGLSRQNRLTARFLVALLRHMRTESPQAGAFVHTLPVAAVDGTLRKRMAGTCAAGTVRAKTGFLTGACTLSGYVDRKGRHLVFSMLMNGHTVDGDDIRAIQNRACVALAGSCGP
jgi:D-alanyl-D-alanine carboxypeptidase/D-alanyl-D-alanine-endopeptidase (penicillin-binding protein 4)